MKVISPITISTPDATFTRASTATYWDKTGTLQTAAIDTIRLGYDPNTLEFLGAIIEPAKTNLFLNSNTLATQTVLVSSGNYYWLSFFGTGTITLGNATITEGGTGTSVTGTAADKRKIVLVLAGAGGYIDFTVTGTVTNAQLEDEGSGGATSYIPSGGTQGTRSADVITGNGLVYSSATETVTAYNGATSYNLGDRARYDYKIWESVSATAHTGNTPSSTSTFWVYVSDDNKHSALDALVNSTSSATEELIMVIKPGSTFNSIALLNVSASIVDICVYHSTLYAIVNETYGLSTTDLYSWYEYFFNDPLVARTQIISQLASESTNDVITIKLKGAVTDTVSLGQFVVGTQVTLGYTQYGANAGIVDYSKKEADDFGNITFVERNYAKRVSSEIAVPSYMLNQTQRNLYALRARPSLWVFSDDPTYEECLVVFGFIKQFNSAIKYPTYTLLSLEIEGLI